MLQNVTLKRPDMSMSFILGMISGGQGPVAPKNIGSGLYRCGHWNFGDLVVEKTNPYPDLSPDFNSYGVCDSPEQFAQAFKRFIDDDSRRFCVSFVHIRKADQPLEGGWRWHKWGKYIGEHEPLCEYLHDEPEITEIYTYHVYELI